jgi:adhesin transport system membrane fusion protein
VIQNLEGGILSELTVVDGQSVKRGQILLRIDDTRFVSSYREQQQKYLALLASVARLVAETNGKSTIDFPPELKDYHDLMARETSLFESRKNGLKETIGNLQTSFNIAKKELDITTPLVKQGVMSQVELLHAERVVNEIHTQIDEKTNAFKEQAHADLNKQKAELNAITEELMSQKDRVTRTTVRSPVDGVVKKIYINTIGGVIQPGMDIMEVVPDEDYLIVEARVLPKDIAFIDVGQRAKVKFSAYDFSIYGGLDGKVVEIGADTITDDKAKETYYEVKVRTEQNYLEHYHDKLPVKVGMVATVDIITGHKSILSYILKPILKAKQYALRER